MTFGISLKCKINGECVIISMIDSLSIVVDDNTNKIIEMNDNTQKLFYNSNSIFSYIEGGTLSNIKLIFTRNNFDIFLKDYIKLENFSKFYISNTAYLISDKSNLNLIYLRNKNKRINSKSDLNFHFFGPDSYDSIKSNIIGNDLNLKLNSIPKFETYFEALLQLYLIFKRALSFYKKYVNLNIQFSIIKKDKISILHHPEIIVNLNEYKKINFLNFKIHENKLKLLYTIILENFELYLNNRKTLEEIKKEKIEDLIIYFVNKELLFFIELLNNFERYI